MKCACKAFDNMNPGNVIGGGNSEGKGESHTVTGCSFYSSAYGLAKPLYAIARFFTRWANRWHKQSRLVKVVLP